MRFYNGNSPCVGCNRVIGRPSKAGLCRNCKSDLELGAIRRKELEADEGRYAYVLFPGHGLKSWFVPKGWHFAHSDDINERTEGPHRTEHPRYRSESDSKIYNSKKWASQVRELLTTFDLGHKPEAMRIQHEDGSFRHWGYATLTTKQAFAFLRFMNFVGLYCNHIEKLAKAEGSNMLVGMLRDEIGMSDITNQK